MTWKGYVLPSKNKIKSVVREWSSGLRRIA